MEVIVNASVVLIVIVVMLMLTYFYHEIDAIHKRTTANSLFQIKEIEYLTNGFDKLNNEIYNRPEAEKLIARYVSLTGSTTTYQYYPSTNKIGWAGEGEFSLEEFECKVLSPLQKKKLLRLQDSKKRRKK